MGTEFFVLLIRSQFTTLRYRKAKDFDAQMMLIYRNIALANGDDNAFLVRVTTGNYGFNQR